MRRLTLRATGLLAIALAAITCTDATTGPGTRAPAPARLGLAPSLSPAASRANTVLAGAGVMVAQVHIVLRTAEGVVAKDTVIAFPATQDTLSVELPLQIQGTEQSFTATLELQDAAGVTLFSQTQLVTARASSLPAAPPPVIVLEYVGPGAAARAVTVSPATASLAPNTPLALAATATDSAGRDIPDLIVGWTSSDTSIATVVSTGRAAATLTGTGRRGSVTVSATTPNGVVGTARVTALPQPARLVVVSGDAQTAVAGHALAQPLVLELQGLDGGPIPNAAVVVTATTAGATVGTGAADTLYTTDALGRTSATLTLGRTAGAYAFQARAGTLLAPAISATATAAPAIALTLTSGNGQSGAAGSALALPFAVTATNEFGAPVVGATVAWTRTGGTGAVAAATSVTDAQGVALMTYTLGNTVSTDSIRASLPGLTTPASTALFTTTATAGAAAKLLWLQAPQDTIVVGATFAPVAARLADRFGNAVHTAGVKVRVRGQSPDSSNYADSTLTDTAGIAQVALGSYKGSAGRLVLTLSAAGLDSLVHQITAVTGAAAQLRVVSGVPTTAASGVAFAQPVVLQVTDVGGNAVAAAAITVTASAAGGATLSGTTAVATAADGRATFSALTMNGVAGSYQLHFDATGLAGVITPPVALTGGVASALVITAGDGQAGTVGTTLPVNPTVRVTDVNGNPVRAGHVIFTPRNGGHVAPDTVALDANGSAATQWTLGTTAGGDTLVARLDSSTVAPVEFTATATAGAPAQLAIVGTSPTTAASGAPLSPQPVLQLRDAQGNDAPLAGVTVTATVTSGSATLANATATTNAAGTATFSGLTLSGPAGTVTLAYSAAGYASATSAPISMGAGAPGQLALRTAPPATSASGAAFAQAPVVQLEDAAGNAVSAPGVAVTASITSGSGTLIGTTTVNTSALGQASFDGLGLSGAVGAYTLSFGASGVTPVTASVTLTAGAPASLTAVAGDAQSGGLGGLAPVAPKVAVKDASNNPVSGVSVTFTAVSAGDSVSNGTFGRTATVVTDAAGEAALTAWKFGTTGYDTVTAAVGALTARFTATATLGAATHFVVVSGGGQSGIVTDSLPQLIVVEARDANEQPVPNTAAKFNYNFETDQGLIRVVGDCSGDCIPTDSATTDANGRAAFAWFLSYHAKVDSVYVENDQIAPTLITATAVAGPPAMLVFDAPSGLDDDAGNTLSPFRVYVSDIGGYDTLRVSGNITLDLRKYNPLLCDGTCPPPPAPTGTLTAPVVNGIATFSNVSIPSAATNLYFVATYDQVAGVEGGSDLFDISPAGPHFVVVSPYPTDVVAGTAVQVQLRSQDAHGNALPNTPILVYRGDFNGSVDLIGGGAAGYRDSSTTDASGLQTLTWVMPNTPQAGLSISVSNYETAQPLYLYANAVLGPPAKVATNGELALDDDVGNTLNGFWLYITDVGGNRLTGIDTSLVITLSGGDPTATLTQQAPIRFADGSAWVTGLSIDKIGASYKLVFSVPGSSWTGETDLFDISPATMPAMALLAVQGRSGFVIAPNGTSTVTLLAKDASNNPVANQHVVVYSYNTPVCWLGAPGNDHEGAYTDAQGLATLTVHGGAVNGGCSLNAQADNNGNYYDAALQGVVYAGAATHVWASTTDGRFEFDSSWVRLSDGAPAVPGATDRPYIASDSWGAYPSLSAGDHSLAALEMEPGTLMGLNGYTLTVTGDVAAANATIQGGPMVVRGHSTVSGSIQDLQLGGTTDCTGDDLTVQNLSTYTAMRVRCRTTVGATVTNDSLIVAPGAALLMAGPGSSLTSNHADIRGDSLALDGQFNVSSTATLAPAALTMASTSFLTVGGDATLGANGTSRLSLAGRLYFGGALTADGTGSSVADTVTVIGNASFVGQRFEFRSGVLNLVHDLSVPAARSTDQFVATGDHLTRLIGYEAQSVNMTYGGSGENLARVQVLNQTGPVSVLTAITGGTSNPLALELTAGATFRFLSSGEIGGDVVIGDGARLTFDGSNSLRAGSTLYLMSNSFWTVNGSFSAPCSDTYLGNGAQNVTIGGTGSINGVSPPSYAGCVPQ